MARATCGVFPAATVEITRGIPLFSASIVMVPPATVEETNPDPSINKLNSVAIVAAATPVPYVLVYGTPFIIIL